MIYTMLLRIHGTSASESCLINYFDLSDDPVTDFQLNRAAVSMGLQFETPKHSFYLLRNHLAQLR